MWLKRLIDKLSAPADITLGEVYGTRIALCIAAYVFVHQMLMSEELRFYAVGIYDLFFN